MAEPGAVPRLEQVPGTSTPGTEQMRERPRLSTGVPGLDIVLGGGLPEGALLMIGGPPGAGKTVLAEQVAFHQVARGRHALILTTLSEPNEKLIRHIEGFSWFDGGRLGREIEFLSLHEIVERDGMAAAQETISGWARIPGWSVDHRWCAAIPTLRDRCAQQYAVAVLDGPTDVLLCQQTAEHGHRWKEPDRRSRDTLRSAHGEYRSGDASMSLSSDGSLTQR